VKKLTQAVILYVEPGFALKYGLIIELIVYTGPATVLLCMLVYVNYNYKLFRH